MASSAILRRCGSVGILRSPRISVEGANYYFRISCYSRESDANRMMSTATSGVVSSPSAPWLMLPPAVDGSGNIAYEFQCLAKKTKLNRTNKIDELRLPVDIIEDVEFVGSSHGWLALLDWRSHDLFLSNPIADRHIKLPPLGGADRVILTSPSPLLSLSLSLPMRERSVSPWRLSVRAGCGSLSGRRAAAMDGLSSPPPPPDHAYDNLVYSSSHKRLFCICKNKNEQRTRLECWDVHHQPPTLDWAIPHNKALDFGHRTFRWPALTDLKRKCDRVNYLVCDEHSGELFLVVRHVNLRAGPYGSLVYEDMVTLPYKTVDFDVYKIDPATKEVRHMRNSLQGLAMFVGINHPFAIPAAGVAGVEPDSVYFTDENRLFGPVRLEGTDYGGHDNGVFDYHNKDFYPCSDFYPIEYEKIRKVLPLPLWFTPSPTTII